MSRRPPLPLAGAAAYLVYQLIAVLYTVYLRLRLFTGWHTPLSRRIFLERLGRWPGKLRPGTAPCVWLHAASLGEVLLLGRLLARLRVLHPEAHLLVTTNTPAGSAAAERLNADEIRYFPVDYAPIVREVLARVRPCVVIFAETEIWPCMLLETAGSEIVTVMINARLSQRSHHRYRMVVGLIAAVVGSFALVCARDQTSAGRLSDLGVEEGRLLVLGDLKLDAIDAEEVEQTPDLLGTVVADTVVALAISTHEGEDEVVIDAFARLRQRHHGLKLVVAPRHPGRAAAVATLARTVAEVACWSQLGGAGGSDWEVLVVDTAGQLRGFMKRASVGFVGGSLVGVGGHNLLEPAAFGLPIATGPNLDNVEDQARALGECGCLDVVADAQELATLWGDWLDHPDSREARSRGLRDFIASNGGALDATVASLDSLITGHGC